MNLDRKNIQRIIFIGIILILVYLGLQHMNIIFQFLQWLLYVAMPFIVAICCTFFLNVPLKAIEKHLFRPKQGKEVSPFLDKIRRPVAIALSLLLFIAVITVLLLIVIPKLGESIETIVKSVPGAIDSLVNFINELSENNDFVKSIVENININWDDVRRYVSNFLQNDAAGLVSSTMSMIGSIFSVALNVIMGIILSIYTLMKKERISSGAKKLVYSIFPMKSADFIVELGSLMNKSFYNVITGQMMECIILGSLTALGMTILGFPYAALVGVMVAVLSWIPMFGVYIGAGIGAILMLIDNPINAVWFLIFMVCLQQVEGNLIYPRVVGNNVGLPPIVLISAIVIFSSFFGIIGLLVCAPITSVIYTLVRRFVFTRLRTKKIPHEKYEEKKFVCNRRRVHSAKHNTGKRIKFNLPMKMIIKEKGKQTRKKEDAAPKKKPSDKAASEKTVGKTRPAKAKATRK